MSVISAWSAAAFARADVGAFKSAAHAGQGGSQIVRDIVGGLLDLPHQHLDAVEHGIEIFRQPIPFVVRCRTAARAPPRPLCHDGAAGGVDGFDPADRASR